MQRTHGPGQRARQRCYTQEPGKEPGKDPPHLGRLAAPCRKSGVGTCSDRGDRGLSMLHPQSLLPSFPFTKTSAAPSLFPLRSLLPLFLSTVRAAAFCFCSACLAFSLASDRGLSLLPLLLSRILSVKGSHSGVCCHCSWARAQAAAIALSGIFFRQRRTARILPRRALPSFLLTHPHPRYRTNITYTAHAHCKTR